MSLFYQITYAVSNLNRLSLSDGPLKLIFVIMNKLTPHFQSPYRSP